VSYLIKKGATSQSVELYIVDATDGTPETGVIWNTAGIDLKYRRKDAVAVSITEAALTTPALTDTWETGGFLEIGNGVYRLDLPDAAVASAAGIDRVVVFGTVTGMVVLPVTIHLTTLDLDTVMRGTDSAATSAKQDTMETTLNDVPTTAEFEARTILADAYVVVGDTIAGVTLVTTCTTNSDMRGTNDANTTAPNTTVPDAAGTMAALIGAAASGQIVAVDGAPATIGGMLNKMLSDSATAATYDAATDSLEAIRDQGDTAWLTGGGGAAPTVTQIREEMDSNSTQLAEIVEDTGTTLDDLLKAIPIGDSFTRIGALGAGLTAITDKTDLLPDGSVEASDIADMLTVAGASVAIDKATILTEVNGRLGDRGLTDIDSEIVAAGRQICSRVPGIMQKTGTLNFLINTNSIALPTDFVAQRSLTNSSQVPLEWVKTLTELQARLSAVATAGTPKAWTIFGGKAYIYPTCTPATALTLHYCYEDSSADLIRLPNDAQEALIEGVCVLIELAHGTAAGEITGETVTHKKFFDEEIGVLNARYGWR